MLLRKEASVTSLKETFIIWVWIYVLNNNYIIYNIATLYYVLICRSIIYEWVINLSELYNTHCDTSGTSIGCSQHFRPSPKPSQQRKPNLKKSKSETHTEIKLEKELENLTAMFPSLCMSQIKPVLARHGEDIDACVSELLQIAETKLQGRTTKQVKVYHKVGLYFKIFNYYSRVVYKMQL